jgi:hypothetical protein
MMEPRLTAECSWIRTSDVAAHAGGTYIATLQSPSIRRSDVLVYVILVLMNNMCILVLIYPGRYTEYLNAWLQLQQ